MPPVQEPGVIPETVTPAVNGSKPGELPAQPSATVPEVTADPTNAELERVQAELENERKAKNQATMRANQLENERKEAERTQLEEQGNWKQIAEEAERKLHEREEADEARRAQSEAKILRDSVIDSYPDEKVRKVAKAMTSKNDSYFYWGSDVTSEEEAQAQVKAQLDILAAEVGTPAEPEKPAGKVDANNPLEGRDSTPGEDLDALRDRLAGHTF